MDIQENYLDMFLTEDIGKGDVTAELVFDGEEAKAYIFVKESCVLAGLVEAVDMFKTRDITVFPKAEDGEVLKPGTTVMELQGKAADMMTIERTALNILAKMSGIASETRLLVEKVMDVNPDCHVAATRKTTPGFRYYEKKAVVIGGGNPHRFGLFDAVMIKDNHLAVLRGLDNTLERIKERSRPVEIEVENLEDALKCANAGVEIIMLDNFTPEDAEAAYKAIKEINEKAVVEVSGGINADKIDKYCRHADIISVGYITQSAKAIDFSMEIVG